MGLGQELEFGRAEEALHSDKEFGIDLMMHTTPT